MLIQSTQKLLTELNKKLIEIKEQDIFSWHANITSINRRKTIILINDMCRYVITIHGIKAMHINIIEDVITNAIKEALKNAGINESIIQKYIESAPNIQFAKTKNRSLVGSMTEIIKNIECFDDFLSEDKTYQNNLNDAINHLLFKSLDKEYIHPADELYKMMDKFAGKRSSVTKSIKIRVKLRLGTGYSIWRRILVPYNVSFYKLHTIIQAAFDWDNFHLYRFVIKKGKDVIADSSKDDDYFYLQKKPIPYLHEDDKLCNYINKCSKIIYTYDLGDDWKHDITIEGITEHDRPYPICIKGAGIAPPEDVGGLYGYERILTILEDKTHPEYKQTAEWLEFSGTIINIDFNIINVNNKLRRNFLNIEVF